MPGDRAKPCGRRVYLYCLPLYVNEKMSLSESCKGRQKNALTRSMHVNHFWSHVMAVKAVYGLGTGTVSVRNMALMALRSCAIRYFPVPCFSTGKIGVFQRDCEGSSTPTCSSPSVVSAIPSSASGLCLYCGRVIGASDWSRNRTGEQVARPTSVGPVDHRVSGNFESSATASG